MQYYFPESLNNLIQQLAKLPGIGPKSAQRLAFHLLNTDEEKAVDLAKSIVNARRKIGVCSRCGNLSDGEICAICKDSSREKNVLCVVEQAKDIISIERSHSFHGYYHVLQGAISPMEGIGPDKLNIDSLLARLNKGDIKEVVMATNPNVEGEATALYLAKRIKQLGITVTRLAHGVPVGGDLEYADEATLAQAFCGRRAL
ncbi:MAG: recombination mediator RecR [Bacillota bacterium]|jgi:recombination protein RecR